MVAERSVAVAITALLIVSLSACATQADAIVSLEERLKIFVDTYEDQIEAFDQTTIKLRTGAELVVDDGEEKSPAGKLANADVEDMLSQIYPTLTCRKINEKPARNFDPGRIRNDTFFKAVYGGSPRAVAKDLVRVKWFGHTLSVTKRMGVARALQRVADELQNVSKADKRFLHPMGGTFNWRTIAGTRRLSVHSFGAAIDLNPAFANYWRWSGGKPGNVPRYVNRVPESIIAAFEKHNFIWGGRWYHFDTMHFEYRPALMAIARLAEKRGCAKS